MSLTMLSALEGPGVFRLRAGLRVLWRTVAVLLVALAGLLAAPPARAIETAATGEDEEAAYLHRFIGYIEWPTRTFTLPTSAIVVGIAGSDRTLAALARTVNGRQVQGRPVEVRRLDVPAQLADVHLMYVGRDAWAQFPEWVTASRQHAVVLATNAPEGVARGATLGLVQSGPRLRFEASIPAATEVGAKLSARLLEVAERVIGGPR